MYAPQRLAYFPEHAEPMLAGLRHLILVESKPPVSFFGYPTSRSFLAPADCQMHILAGIGADGTAALEALVEECGAGKATIPVPDAAASGWTSGSALTLDEIGRVLATLLPERSVVSDEMVSSGEVVGRHLLSAAPHDHLPVTGGSIGQGLPVAVGAAMACPDRKVVALEADGSAMYTLQALWTMAREHLDVTTVIFANRRYRILDIEMKRTGGDGVGPSANAMIDIGHPDLDWVRLAEAQGVEGSRARTTDEFAQQFQAAVKSRVPVLIEAVID
jgi:acetolactate synthase I/II/III large subunit